MTLDPAILKRLSVSVTVTDYVRIIARVHAATPLGMGPGRSRFSSPRNRFHVLYLRIPMKPATDSDAKPATHSDFIPAGIPIGSRPPSVCPWVV